MSALGFHRPTGKYARLERTFDPTAAAPTVLAVMPLDRRTATTPIAAAMATLLDAILPHPVAAVDADGTAQPLRRLLESTGAGDIVGLAASHDATLRRRSVEDFVDMGARVPLASCWIDGPGAIPPGVFRDAAWKLRRRFPNLVLDVPHGVPRSTLGVATDIATHVLLVADPQDLDHDWLHDGKSVLASRARDDAVTIVAVGGDDSVRSACHHGDIIPLDPLVDPGYRATPARLSDSDGRLLGLTEIARRVLR
ncbi:hypothetical protein GCM10009624_29030 [Gordonia sinesedis]